MKFDYTPNDLLRFQKLCHASYHDIGLPKDLNVRRHIGALREAIMMLETRLEDVKCKCDCNDLRAALEVVGKRLEALDVLEKRLDALESEFFGDEPRRRRR